MSARVRDVACITFSIIPRSGRVRGYISFIFLNIASRVLMSHVLMAPIIGAAIRYVVRNIAVLISKSARGAIEKKYM